MVSLRRLAWMCRNLAKQHIDDPDVPAAPDGADGYAKWVQIALILFRVELQKSPRETEDYLNEMHSILAAFELDELPSILVIKLRFRTLIPFVVSAFESLNTLFFQR